MRLAAWLLMVAVCVRLGAQADVITDFGVFLSRTSLIGTATINATHPITGFLFVAGVEPFPNVNESLGCYPFSVPNQFANRIALIERGDCNFGDKIRNAQNSGAIAVVVYDRIFNASLTTMVGDDVDDINIPSVFVNREHGLMLRSAFITTYTDTGLGLNVTLTESAEGRDPELEKKELRTIGLILGVFFGASVIFWISFYVWRQLQTSRRQHALKKLKRIKYCQQTIPAIVDTTPGAASTEPSAADTETNNSSAESSEKKGVTFVEGVELQEVHDVEAQVDEATQNGADSAQTKAESNEQDTETRRRSSSAKPSLPPKPMTFSRLKRLNPLRGNRRRWLPRDNNSNQLYDSGNCTVCLEDFQENEEIMVLPCRHIFHPDCVANWLTSHGQCPVCKANVIQSSQRPGEEYPRGGLGLLFGASVAHTIIVWFVCLCFFIMLSYFMIVNSFYL